MSLKTLRIILWLVVAIVVLAYAWFKIAAPMLNQKIANDFGRGDYHLETTLGGEFSEAALKGQASAVFFGFTHCPDVCPTTLGEMTVWQDELGEDAKNLRIFFVTVDPERDTLDQLRDYVGWLPGAAGVSGSREQVDKAMQAFHIYARKVPLSDGGYTMDHSAYVLLFDAKGRFFEPIGYQEDPDRAVAKIRRMLAAD
ncbi:MAG: SCO family protein [Deltaproteobacteria bacterium]